MKLHSVLTSSILALPLLLTACDSGKTDIPVNAQSAQKAADEFAKTFQQAETTKKKVDVTAKKACGKAGTKAEANAGAGQIAGIPKVAVEGVKGAVDATKNLATKAMDKVSDATASLLDEDKKTSSDSKKSGNKGQGCQMKEEKAMGPSTQSTVDKFAETFEKNPEPAKETASAQKPQDKKAMSEAEIAGLPKGVVKGVKEAYQDTKEAASKAVDKVSELGEKITGDDEKSESK
jgi:hypothetical protein